MGLEFHGIPIPEFTGIPDPNLKTPEFRIPNRRAEEKHGTSLEHGVQRGDPNCMTALLRPLD